MVVLDIIRFLQHKPQGFGSFPLFLAICIVAGMIRGWVMSKSTIGRKSEKALLIEHIIINLT